MSTAVNPTHTSVPTSSRAPSIPANHTHSEPAYTNGHHHHHHDTSATQQPGSSAAKKGKQKKTDPNEASKLIAAKISQLELDAAGDKEQEAEIGGFPRLLSEFVKYIRVTSFRFKSRTQKFCELHVGLLVSSHDGQV